MNWFKNYIKEHCKASAIVIFIWLTALLIGMYTGLFAKGTNAADMQNYIESSLAKSDGFFEIFKRGIISDFKFVAVFYICSLFLVLLPFSAVLIAFKGFSSGLTASVIVRLYTLKGVAVTITAIALPLFFSLPVYLCLFVSGLEFPFEVLKRRRQLLWSEKWQLQSELMAKVLVMFLALCLINAAEALMAPYLWSVLAK